MKSASRGAFFPSAHRTTDKGNGRINTHRILSAEVRAPEVDFPFAAQVFRLRRTREENGKRTEETVCGITSMGPERADPHQLMKYCRGHWSIENKLHLPRDTTYKEDGSRIRKPHGARSLASLKNLAIGLHALGVFKRANSARETIPKMNRRIARNPQIAVKFCITPCNKQLLQKTE